MNLDQNISYHSLLKNIDGAHPESATYWPESFNWDRDYEIVIDKLKTLRDNLQNFLNLSVTEHHIDIQDASFHGWIELPKDIQTSEKCAHIVVSNFGNLATITGEYCIPDEIALEIRKIIKDCGYVYVPHTETLKPYDGQIEWVESWHHRFFSHM